MANWQFAMFSRKRHWMGHGKLPGSAGILACGVSGSDRLTEGSRQGCLRSQEVCPTFSEDERMLRRLALIVLILLAMASAAFAQLPPDAVMLDKVKIPEAQKSVDLCPVYLEPSDPTLPTWEYKGVSYRGARADAQEKFFKDPDKYAKAAERQRFINNFMS